MVERAFRLVTKELSGLHEAAFLLGFFALLSQIVGLVRDRLLAQTFGMGNELDIYYAAFRVPDLLYVSIASFVASTALIPFIYAKEGQGPTVVKEYLSRILTTFSVLMILVVLVAWLLIPIFAAKLVPGFTPEARATYVTLSRILLLSPFFLGISNLFGSITQSGQRFFTYASAPVLYNVGILVGVLVFLPRWGLPGLAGGVILGTILHAGIQIPSLIRQRLLPVISSFSPVTELRDLVALSFPRTLGLAIYQIALMVLIALATRIEEGGIAVFTFATNIHNIPLMIIGSSYAVAAFPTLARLFEKKDDAAFFDQMVRATRHIVFWSAPAIVLFIILRAQIVRVLLGSGAFDWTATRLTAAALALLMISLIAHALILLFARGYYAMGNTRLPLLYNSIGAALMVIFGGTLLWAYTRVPLLKYFFEDLLRVDGLSSTAILMLPLSYSIGMIFSVMLYLWNMEMRFPQFFRSIRKTFLHAVTSSVFAGYVAYHALQVLAPLTKTDTFTGIFLQGLGGGIAGVLGWVLLLRLMDNREIKEVFEAFTAKLWKTARPIAVEQEEI